VAAAVLVALVSILSAQPTRAADSSRVADEWDLVHQMNGARRAAGLRPLAVVDDVRDVARGWSDQMARDNALSHNPTGFQQLRARHPDAGLAGENVGFGPSPDVLHRAFMNSPHHRANILGDFDHVGIGATRTAATMWATVDFIRVRHSLPFLTRVPLRSAPLPSDAIAAAVATSRRLGEHSADAVVIGADDLHGDVLAGAPLAAAHHGPVLLTPADAMPVGVLAEAVRVARAGATAYVLGSTTAVSPAVEQQLFAAGLLPIRIAGSDRYATAALIALHLTAAPTEVVVASADSLEDVALGGAAAGERGDPLLLVSSAGVPSATATYLALNPAARRVVVGDRRAVPDAVANAVGSSERLAGADASETSAIVAARFETDATRVVLTTPARASDAFIASSEIAVEHDALLTVGAHVGDGLYAYASDHLATWTTAEALAPAGAFSDETLVWLLS